jgi:3-oxoacyl-[acyl-carrier-protein] synthase II
MSRIVITGAGVVSPIGSGLVEFRQGLESALIGVDRISCFDTAFFPSTFGAEARAKGKVIATTPRQDRKEIFLRQALSELFQTVAVNRYTPQDRLLILGAGIDYFDLLSYVEKKPPSHWSDDSLRANKVVDQLACEFEINGGHFANVSACVASTQAMGLALRILRQSPHKAIITGGFDSMLSHLHYMGFYKLGALSDWDGPPQGALRPFDKRRCGLVIGEGAGTYLFENIEHAKKTDILAEVAGYSATMDAYMVTDPEPSGRALAQAGLLAIQDAGITPERIDMIDLHGTGTVKNALAETKALESIFPRRFHEIPVFCLKGQIGHLIGACGAMEILGVIDALQNQRVLPSVNCEEPDPEIPLNIIRDEPLKTRIEYVLKLNAAFGGQNTAMVLKKYEQ